MNSRITGWLKEHISLKLPERKPPSPLVRNLARVVQVLFLVVLCVFLVWRTVLFFEVKGRFARIRVSGLPASGAELNTWRRPVPDAENGALVMTQAFHLIRTFPDNRSKELNNQNILWRTNIWSAATHALVASYLQMNTPALAKARDGLHFSRFRYPADFSYGPDTLLPHLAHLKALARIAALQCGLEADNGHGDDWPQYAELQLKLAATLEEEPQSISYLVRCSMMNMAAKATERSLNRVPPGQETCQKLQAAFIEASKTNLLSFVFVGERAIMIPVFRLSHAEAERVSPDETDDPNRTPQRFLGKPNPFLWLTGFFERDLNFYLKTMDKAISLVAMPPPASLILTNYMESVVETARKKLYIYTGLTLLPLERMPVREAATQSSMMLAATALAVERFRYAHNRLPDSLAALTPQFLDSVPSDPFDGAPLRYRKLASGYVLYSIGSDGHDDGGQEPPPTWKSRDKSSYDITFIVEH